MMIGSDQVTPLSVERMTATKIWFDGCTPDPLKRVKTFTSVPSGRTAIWLPIVNRLALGLKMARGASQVALPSVVRANMMSDRKENAWSGPRCQRYTRRTTPEQADP
jgi:hypothetical protein